MITFKCNFDNVVTDCRGIKVLLNIITKVYVIVKEL